jgi:lipopolysaccharide biosynthesis protein
MNKLRSIAIYLPQFHPIPENDAAWGEGFTEWTNVKKALPLFEGHYQPHVPHETVGYYDLRDPEVLINQAKLAKEYGIYGFAFYHYWFNGKRLLNLPIDNMLKSGKPDFPFCFIWANENWTRRWDGLDNEIIAEQKYSIDDDKNHIRFLCEKVFPDPRYITVEGKPFLLIYRTELLPDIKETARIWRDEAKKFGFKDLYLARVENFVSEINPLNIGFDAAMEFSPDSRSVGIFENSSDCLKIDYNSTVFKILSKDRPEYPMFRCVFPGWDNSPRRKTGCVTYCNNSPEMFKHFVYRAADHTKSFFDENHQFLFINAWNEWGEGCHLEPDKKNSNSYLKALQEGLAGDPIANLSEYTCFLEKHLDKNIDEIKNLETIRLTYDRLVNSKKFKFYKFISKPILRFKELFK